MSVFRSLSRKSPRFGPGPVFKATGQSGPGQQSAGKSRYQNPAGQQIPTFRDKNPGQSRDVAAEFERQLKFNAPFNRDRSLRHE